MGDNMISVITPTYNRAHLLHRIYESLISQTYRNFEWIVIDDGSTDNTKKIIDNWISEDIVKISYFYQHNSGKHEAVNNGVRRASGKWITIIDSDDAFRCDSFEIFLKEYEKIPDTDKPRFKGVTARCFAADGVSILGDSFPKGVSVIDAKETDFKYKYRIQGELWGLTKKSVFEEFPFPKLEGAHFYPESVLWDTVSEKYLTRYINVPLRYYYFDAGNSVTRTKKYTRFKENYELWVHNINKNSRYFVYSPKMVVKSYIGFTMDTLFCGYRYIQSLKRINGLSKKVFCLAAAPLGLLCYLMKK